MNVLEKKYPSREIASIVELLQYDENPIQLLGTGGNASQNYPSDIDLFSKINNVDLNDISQIGDEAREIFTNMLRHAMSKPDMFFIEFKIQNTDGKKLKFKTAKEFLNDKAYFKRYFNDKIDYCKFDFVLLKDGLYTELSSIYSFNPEPLNYDELRKSLIDDMKDLIKEKKYYKSLKRLFAILKLAPHFDEEIDYPELVEMSKLFNSVVGELYRDNSVLKAIKLVEEFYPDNVEMIKKNYYVFNNMRFRDYNDLDKIISSYDDLINREGLKFIKQYHPELLRGKMSGGGREGANEFSSRPLPSAMAQNHLSGGNYLGRGIFDGTEGMSGWEGFKYGFNLPFKAVKEVNKILPLSMFLGAGNKEKEGGNLIGEFFNSAINPFYGIQKYKELTGKGIFDSTRKLLSFGGGISGGNSISDTFYENTFKPWEVIDNVREHNNIIARESWSESPRLSF